MLIYRLPTELHPHVKTIFTSPRRGPSLRVDSVTPPFLRWLYNMLGYVPAVVDWNKLGIASFPVA
jgi:hypothetical protein